MSNGYARNSLKASVGLVAGPVVRIDKDRVRRGPYQAIGHRSFDSPACTRTSMTLRRPQASWAVAAAMEMSTGRSDALYSSHRP